MWWCVVSGQEREVSSEERAKLMGTEDYLGVPVEVWRLVSEFNGSLGSSSEAAVDVRAAPLLKAVYGLGGKTASPDLLEALKRTHRILGRLSWADQDLVQEAKRAWVAAGEVIEAAS